jgi:hypothetical protein
MPSHIAHARRLAQAGGISNVRFIEGDFTALQNDPSALVDATGAALDGQTDYVVAHGIASWVSPQVRASLWALAGRLLKPGGLHYTSYNTEPGWLAAKPFQHLVMLRQGQGRTGAQALRSGMDTFSALEAAKSKIYATFTTLKPRLAAAAEQDIAYLTQEYNNRYWEPLRVSDMMAAASGAKLDWVGSATLPEQFGNLLPPDIAKIIDSESDPVLRETVRDLAVVQSFRRDMYVKGSNVAWPSERLRRVSETRVVASHLLPLPQGNDGKMEIITTLGKVRVNRAACQAILDRAGEQGATLAELQQGPGRTEPLGSMVQKVTPPDPRRLAVSPARHRCQCPRAEPRPCAGHLRWRALQIPRRAAPGRGHRRGRSQRHAVCRLCGRRAGRQPHAGAGPCAAPPGAVAPACSALATGRWARRGGGPVFEAELEKRARSYIEPSGQP